MTVSRGVKSVNGLPTTFSVEYDQNTVRGNGATVRLNIGRDLKGLFSSDTSMNVDFDDWLDLCRQFVDGEHKCS